MDRPTPARQQDMPGPSTAPTGQAQCAPILIEEGELDSETDPSILEVPAIHWARYVGLKIVQYVKMGHAAKIAALEDNNRDFEQAVRETEGTDFNGNISQRIYNC